MTEEKVNKIIEAKLEANNVEVNKIIDEKLEAKDAEVTRIIDAKLEAKTVSESSIQERHKAHFEYLKHITTLSTGSIVLIATFLEKLFQKPLLKWCIVVAVIGFMLSILASLIYYTVLIASFGAGNDQLKNWERNTITFSIIATWLGLFAGLLFLAIFTIVNLNAGVPVSTNPVTTLR